MLVAILIIISLSFLDKSNFKGSQYKPGFRIVIIIFFTTVVILGILGGKHVEYPYIGLGAGSTVVYFSSFVIVLVSSVLENTLIDLKNIKGNLKSNI